GPMAAMVGEPVNKSIQGLLKGSDAEHVLLSDLSRRGGRFSTHGISYETFVAMDCLMGHAKFGSGVQPPEFDTLESRLPGFEAWLRLGSIDVSRAEGKISASYEMPNDLVYTLDDGSLSIVFDVDAHTSGMLRTYALSVKESALLRLRLNRACTLNDL